jgi:hypothetical protein
VSIRDRLRKLEEATETEVMVAKCEGCGEEMRTRQGILLDVIYLEWQMHQEGIDALPADTDPDIRWVWEHPCQRSARQHPEGGALDTFAGHRLCRVLNRKGGGR